VAVNTCLDYLRKRKREYRNLAEFLDEMVVQNLEPCGDRALAKLEMDRILRPLRPQLRVILFMTLAEGLTYAETAQVLKLSEAAVAKSVSRFLGKHRKETSVHSGSPPASKGISQHA